MEDSLSEFWDPLSEFEDVFQYGIAWEDDEIKFPRYTFAPLDDDRTQIRLLTWFADTREFRISTHELHNAPSFVAISYTWNNKLCKEKDDYIVVDGKNLVVSVAAWQALWSCRKSSRPMWLDQVCINQSDIGERSSQVAIMGEIYRAADSVVAYLVQDLHDDCEPFAQLSEPAMSRQRAKALDYRLRQLADHTYWTRLWIIQELVLAKKVYVRLTSRNKEIPWAALVALLDGWDFRYRALPARFLRFLENVEKPERERALQLNELIQPFSDSGCSDPRDKVYGLQGMLSDPRFRLAVDYSKSTPEVFLSAVSLMVEQWDRPDEYRELIHRCIKLGCNMMPGEMNLANCFDHVDILSRAAKDTSMDVEARKTSIKKGFEVLVASFGESGKSVGLAKSVPEDGSQGRRRKWDGDGDGDGGRIRRRKSF